MSGTHYSTLLYSFDTLLKNRPPIMYYVKHGTEQEPGHIELSSRTRGGQS